MWKKRDLHSMRFRKWLNTCEYGDGGKRSFAWTAKQHSGGEERVIECRPMYSSHLMGLVENMNKEVCGLARRFRIYHREKATLEVTIESPLLPRLVRLSAWIVRRCEVRWKSGILQAQGTQLHFQNCDLWRGDVVQCAEDCRSHETRRSLAHRDLVGRLRSQRCEHIIGMETVAMEIAHGYRFDTRRSTTEMYQDHLFESRHPSRTGGDGTPAFLVCTTSALRFGMRMLSPDEPIAMYLPPGEEEPGYMWQMKGAMYGTRRALRLFPEHTKPGSWLQVTKGWSAGLLLLGDRHDGCSSRRRCHHRR